MFQNFSLFKKEAKGHPFKGLEEGHVIEPAFKSGGIQYYKLKDIFNTFCARAMDALSSFEEWNMRCSRDFLIAHTTAVDDIVRNPKLVNIVDIAELNGKLKERLMFALPSEDLIYKFASVAYFDESESPYKYDNKYGEEKIKKWKASNEIDAFFLYQRTRDLIPCPDFSQSDFSLLLKTIQKIDKQHLERLISILSLNPQNKDLLHKLQSGKSSELTHLN